MKLKKAIELWERAVNVGVAPSDDFTKRKRIRFLNAIFVVFSPVLLLFTMKSVLMLGFTNDLILGALEWTMLLLSLFRILCVGSTPQ